MDVVRWGVVSTASINQLFIPAVHISDRGKLVAVASRSSDKAEAYAREWEIPKFFSNYQEMFESGIIDAAYISLPNHLHAEWSIKAMQAGLHVLCEKPFAIRLSEVDEMIAVSQKTNCVLAEGLMYRHHPQTKKVGEIIKSGIIGEVSIIRGAFDFFMPKEERQVNSLNVRLIPKYGGGCLWDVGVYPLSFTQYILGSAPEKVMGMQRLGDFGIDEFFAGQMIYSSECFAQISSSFCLPFHTFMEIIGTEGRLYLTRPFVDMGEERELILYPKKGNPKKIFVQTKNIFLGEIEDMHDAILDGKENYISLEESKNHVLSILALYKSARKGEIIGLS